MPAAPHVTPLWLRADCTRMTSVNVRSVTGDGQSPLVLVDRGQRAQPQAGPRPPAVRRDAHRRGPHRRRGVARSPRNWPLTWCSWIFGCPDIDGLEALAQLRAHPATAQLPVVVVTSAAMIGDRERLLAAGFDGYIAKPIDGHRFAGELRDLLSAGNARDGRMTSWVLRRCASRGPTAGARPAPCGGRRAPSSR